MLMSTTKQLIPLISYCCQLYKLGFRHIDGVDAAPGMIAEAKTKGVYQNLTTAYVGVEKLPMEDSKWFSFIINYMFPSAQQRRFKVSGQSEQQT